MHPLNDWFRSHDDEVRAWLADAEMGIALPLYLSVDIRDAGFKTAVVDTNAFPAGWNNVTPESRASAAVAAQKYLSTHFPGITRIGILPENHTRNMYYFDNVAVLVDIVRRAGYEAAITHINPAFEKAVTTVEGSQERSITLLKLERSGNRVTAADFDPDILIINNDLAGGIPEMLDGIEQPLVPLPVLGWFQRRKSRHFEHTAQIIARFAEHFAIDAWQLSTVFASERDVHFRERTGLDRVASSVDTVLDRTRKKYDQYSIKDPVCAFVKDNSGTYGQAIMHVATADEILHMNRKAINQMDVGKGSVKVDEVMIQECVPTRFVTDDWTGEPVLYMMGDTVVGGFARMNTEQGPHDNLNARGAYFTELEALGDVPMHVYTFLVRVARLALAYEMNELATD